MLVHISLELVGETVSRLAPLAILLVSHALAQALLNVLAVPPVSGLLFLATPVHAQADALMALS